jgi:hypothetical protein
MLRWRVRDVVEEQSGEELVERIDVVLHGLCQPLTVLQCRLAMGELSGEPVAMREAIGAALGECERLNAAVGAMREMLRQATGVEER